MIEIYRTLLVASKSNLWLFLTIVVYPISESEVVDNIVKPNPATTLLVTIRELSTIGIVSNLQKFWITSLVSVVGLFFCLNFLAFSNAFCS